MIRAGDDQRSAIARLLGEQAAAGGPLVLLGVVPEGLSDHLIREALARRLVEVDAHPLAASVDAEQVRMALHSAAAQLLDPVVRELILGLNRPRSERERSDPPGAEIPATAEVPAEAVADARLAIARGRGVNETSLRRLATIAAGAGVEVQDLLDAVAVRTVVTIPAPPADAGTDIGAATSPDSAPYPEEIDRATHALRNAAVITVVAIVLIAIAVGVIYEISSSMRVPQHAKVAADAPAPAIPRPAPPPDRVLFPNVKPETAPAPVTNDPADALRSLMASAEEVATDPERAAQGFEAALAVLGDRWVQLSPDRLAAAQDGVVEFLYRASRDPAVARRGAEAVAAPARAWDAEQPVSEARVLPGVWSFGLISRLARERELPAAAQRVFDALPRASGESARSAGSFHVGATGAAFRLPTLLISRGGAGEVPKAAPTAAWQRWIAAVDALTKDDAVVRGRILLAGLETLLTEGPDPQIGNETAKVVALLAAAIPWRAGDEARARLLAWFDAPGVSAADLNAITEYLALRSGAEGVDVSMVLSRGADDAARAELKSRFAAAWTSTDAPTRDALATEWQKLAKEVLDRSHAANTPAASLADAVVLSRLNDAAARIVAGDSPGAGDLLRRLEDPVKAIAIGGSAQADRSLDDGGDDGAWAIRYLAAQRNIPERSTLLTELEGAGGTISRVTAEVVAVDAIRGAPASIRRQAQRVAMKFSGQPAMVNAVLELVPSTPPTNEIAELVRAIGAAPLPSLRDPGWRAAVRRSLVERLLQLLASSSDHGAIDKLAEQLGISYLARIAQGSPGAESAVAEAPARALALWWFRRCQSMTPGGREPLGLDQIERRRVGRERLASGRVQVFASDQMWVFELFAYATAAEQPARAAAVGVIMEKVAEERRGAAHVFDQIRSVERGQTELWAIRLGEGAAP